MNQLKVLRGLEQDCGAEVFLVGGAVRDCLRRKELNDIDIVTRNISPAEFEKYMRRRGSLQLVGQAFGVYLFQPKSSREESMQISFPRTEVSTGPGHRDFRVVSDPTITIEEDSKRRDFTINAMYVPIKKVKDGWKFDKQDVIDFHNGLTHIRQRLVVAVGNAEDRIREDPLRLLRASTLLSRTGYRLEGRTFAAIKKNASLIKVEKAERIGEEITKIMKSGKPSLAFKAMKRTGLLRIVLPEVAACIKCGQNPRYHSFSVFEHLIYAADGACQLTSDLTVRFAALCHDLGKAPTRKVRPNGTGPNDVSFHNHEVLSAQLTYDMLLRLKLSKKFVETVAHLVRYHQYKYDRRWTNKAIRRFIRTVGIRETDLGDLDNYPLFVLRQADRLGNKMKASLPITQKQRDFQARIKQVYKESSVVYDLKDLNINGHDLQRELKLNPGPLIGRIMRSLFSAVEDDPGLNTCSSLLELAKKFMEEGKTEKEGGQFTVR